MTDHRNERANVWVKLTAGSVLALALSSWLPASALERYVGRALTGEGRLAYTETHWRYDRNGRPARLVLYRCPSGDAFARKDVLAVDAPWTPNFEFVDGRDGYREGVRGEGANREVFWQPSSGETRVRMLTVSDSSIIDAGFDEWVRHRWSTLSNAGVQAQFLIPSRGKFLSVRMHRQPSSEVDTVKFRLGWDSWLSGIAPSVNLTYSTPGQRLRVFEGIGTIRTASGEPWPVRIEFPASARTQNAVSAEIDAARALPLDGKCG